MCFQWGRKIFYRKKRIDKKIIPNLSRTELAVTICEHLGWVTASGSYKLHACMKLLEKLEVKGSVLLPGKREGYQRKRSRRHISFTRRTEAKPDIVGKLRDLGSVRVKVVKDRESTGLWDEYVSRYHYLGYKKPFGYFLRYFVISDRGLMGCLMFSGAARALRVRDRWIGWTEKQRLRNLAWVVNNTRFLIFPWIRA